MNLGRLNEEFKRRNPGWKPDEHLPSSYEPVPGEARPVEKRDSRFVKGLGSGAALSRVVAPSVPRMKRGTLKLSRKRGDLWGGGILDRGSSFYRPPGGGS